MAYGVVFDVRAPVEMYDAVHAEILRRAGGSIDGLLVHVGRATTAGFQVVEVWENKDDFERYNQELIGPVVAELSGGQAPPEDGQTIEEFDVRGLVIRGDVVL